MANYFHNLPEKDQRALKILAAILGVLIVYFMLISPAFNNYKASKASYKQNQELLGWINQNAHLISKISSPSSIKADAPLLQVVSISAEESNISVSRLQPEGDKRVRIWVNNASFTNMMQWLALLTDTSDITIASISVDKTSEPGVVNVQCLFTRNN